MPVSTTQLPADPEELRIFAAALQSELYAKTLLIEKLNAALATLRRARYGKSSEKLDRQIEQLELVLADLEESEAEHQARVEAEAVAAPTPTATSKPPRTGNRHPLPTHLPREIVAQPEPCVCKVCGSERLRKIEDVDRSVLEYVASHFKVVVHRRAKMSCRDCEAITEPASPSLPIERGRPGPNLLAHVAVSKYCDHTPLNRQSDIYLREGVVLDRATLADWVGRTAWILQPIAERIGDIVRAGPAIHADDTPIPVLDPGRGRTRISRLWAIVRDERSWGSPEPPAVYYRYTPDRKGEHLHEILAPCRGYLHADGYAGFGKLYKPNAIDGSSQLIEVACWSHARRELFDVEAKTKSAWAREALERIGALFGIERDINGQSAEVRLAVRQDRSVPLLTELRAFYDRTLSKISRKSGGADAIRYSLHRWEALCRFTQDGRLEMSNNAAERAIRPLTLGRRNWTFLGSDTGGERAAVIYTIVQTAKLGGINPEAYIADLISHLPDHPAKKIDELLPWNWRPKS